MFAYVPIVAQTSPGAQVAERIRLELCRTRRSGRQLAAVVGWSAGTTSRKLQGRSPLTVDDLVAAATFLEVDPAVLLPVPRPPVELAAAN